MRRDLPIELVVNTDSGNASDHLELLERFRDSAQHRVPEIRLRTLTAAELAKADWLPASPSLVVACGGDGTLALCAGRLIDSEHVLGLVPLGTMNVYARRAGLPLEPQAALECLLAGEDRSVDVAWADDTLFLNSLIFGMYPRLVALRERWRADHAHWPAFLRWFVDTGRAAAWALLNWRHGSFALELDDAPLSGRCVTFAVTNDELTLHMEETALDAGDLWIYLPRTLARREIAALFLRSIFTHPRDLEPLEIRRAREVVVHVPDGTDYSIDGEARQVKGSIRVHIEPRRLAMRLPPRREAQ